MASTRRIYLLLVLICLSLVIISHIPSVNSQAPGVPAAPAPGGDAPKDGGKVADPPKEAPPKNPGGDNQKNPQPDDGNKNPPPDNGDNGKNGDGKAPDNGGGVSRIFIYFISFFFIFFKGTSCEKLFVLE